MGTQQLFLAVTPGQIVAAGAWGRPLAHLAYRIGGGPHLFRANSPATPQGGLMVIDDGGWRGEGEVDTLCNEILRECAARRFTGVVCRFSGRPVPALEGVAARLGEVCPRRELALYVSEAYGAAAKGTGVLIPTALSGGTLRGRLEDARGRFGAQRLAVWVERSAEDFPLPSPTGSGVALTLEELDRLRREQEGQCFFSGELCAHYFTYRQGSQGHFVLFDDTGSIREKLKLAQSMGVETAFLPYDTTGDILEELVGRP